MERRQLDRELFEKSQSQKGVSMPSKKKGRTQILDGDKDWIRKQFRTLSKILAARPEKDFWHKIAEWIWFHMDLYRTENLFIGNLVIELLDQNNLEGFSTLVGYFNRALQYSGQWLETIDQESAAEVVVKFASFIENNATPTEVKQKMAIALVNVPSVLDKALASTKDAEVRYQTLQKIIQLAHDYRHAPL
jgi:hypothetical protein